MKDFLFCIFMLICLVGLCLCNQYSGYKQAEKNILKSCVANDSFEIEDIKFVCVKCPTKGENNDNNPNG